MLNFAESNWFEWNDQAALFERCGVLLIKEALTATKPSTARNENSRRPLSVLMGRFCARLAFSHGFVSLQESQLSRSQEWLLFRLTKTTYDIRAYASGVFGRDKSDQLRACEIRLRDRVRASSGRHPQFGTDVHRHQAASPCPTLT
jgi:hypothetical protein